MTPAFQMAWTAALVIVNVAAVRGAFYWWDESGALAAAAWTLAAVAAQVVLLRVMFRAIARRR